MALLSSQAITVTLGKPTFTAVNATDTISPDSGLFLVVKNAGGSPDTVTIDDAGTTPGGSNPVDPTFSCPATTGEVWIPIFPAFVNPSTGVIQVSHSFTTSVTSALVKR
jgi:hypothetical protein